MGNGISPKKEGKEKATPQRKETTLLRKELSGSTSDLLDERRAPPRRIQFNVVMIGNIEVSVIYGNITEENADVLVNSVGSDLDLSKGRGSKKISECGGGTIQQECRDNYPEGIREGEIAVTGGGKLKCYQIYHVNLPQWDDHRCQALKSAVLSCLYLAKQGRVTSLAFPPFGSGYLMYPEDKIADMMFEGVIDFEKDNPLTRIQSIVIVCHKSQTEVFQAFVRKAKEVVDFAEPKRVKREKPTAPPHLYPSF